MQSQLEIEQYSVAYFDCVSYHSKCRISVELSPGLYTLQRCINTRSSFRKIVIVHHCQEGAKFDG